VSADVVVSAGVAANAEVVVCADLGSTDTKVAAVDVRAGVLLAAASSPTTTGSDVLHGLDAALAALAVRLPGVDLSAVRACSSAGGGLRLAVVGYETLVSALAGRRVALTAGAQVVHVVAGRLGAADLAALAAARPDMVLLVGGTDGGDADVLRHNAAALAAGPAVPVVVAGNVDARGDAVAALGGRGVGVANVLPRIGALCPEPARTAIRDGFLRHVIGGERLSSGPRLRSLVRAATPDTVLTAVRLLAAQTGHDLLVVDVGGATTDVYSAVGADDDAGGARPDAAAVAGQLWCARTVEGDLGVRGGAGGVVAAALSERLIDPAQADALGSALPDLAARPPGALAHVDLQLAALAVVVALRRHARTGRDLRGVRLVVGSGGVLRHAPRDAALGVLARAVADTGGGWALPRSPACIVDGDYVLAAVGLLADGHHRAAGALLRRDLDSR